MAEEIKEIVEDIKKAIIDGEEDGILDMLQAAMNDGMRPAEIIELAVRPAADIVGQKFEEGEFFLPELVISSDVMALIIKKLEPLIAAEAEGSGLERYKVVIGSVQGDVHDLGKNIVRSSLIAAGYDVVDLGIDVAAEKFIEAVREHRPRVLSLGSYMSTTNLEFTPIIESLVKEGLRDKVKIIVGGAAVTDKTSKDHKADAYAPNAQESVRIINSWVRR
jgi:5-methyltetrahydrofolate--homocysteine methyltransferase